MKTLKKTLALLTSAALLSCSISVYADNIPAASDSSSSTPAPQIKTTVTPGKSPSPTVTPLADKIGEEEARTPLVTASPKEPLVTASPEYVSNTIDVEIDLLEHPNIIGKNVVMKLFTEYGELLDTDEQWIDWSYDSFSMHFDIPEYTLGETFVLNLVSGVQSLKYYDDTISPGGTFSLDTYVYLDDEGDPIAGNQFAMTADPYYEKGVFIYTNDNLNELSPRARLMDGTAMVPVRQVAQSLGLNVYYDPGYESVVVSVGNQEIIFNIGTTYSTIFGWDFNTPYKTCYIDGTVFVPVRTLAEAFDCDLEVLDFGDHLDIVIGPSQKVIDFRNSSPVNRDGISSRTNYLIWVSKSEFRVRVYEGSQYNWLELKSYPCSIGAWDTPTITGQYEYIEKLSSWDYPSYYVGPVMRFYNGYALHSTLLYYGGGEYDGTLNAQISHGCIRLRPSDINWMASNIPLGTKVYITE